MSKNNHLQFKDFFKLCFSFDLKKIQYLFLIFFLFFFLLFYVKQNQKKKSMEIKFIFQNPEEINFYDYEYRGYELSFNKLYIDMIENFFTIYRDQIRTHFNYKNIFDISVKNDISTNYPLTLFITFDYIENKNTSEQILIDSFNNLNESNFSLLEKYFQKGIIELQRMKNFLTKKRESLCIENNLNQFKCQEYLKVFYKADNYFLEFIDEQLKREPIYDKSNFVNLIIIKNYIIHSQSMIMVVIISLLLSYLLLMLLYVLKFHNSNS